MASRKSAPRTDVSIWYLAVMSHVSGLTFDVVGNTGTNTSTFLGISGSGTNLWDEVKKQKEAIVLVDYKVLYSAPEIKRIYNYAGDEKIYFVVNGLSKPEEIEKLTNDVEDFCNSISAKFDKNKFVSLAQQALDKNTGLLIGHPIPFSNIPEIVKTGFVSVDAEHGHYVELVSENEIKNKPSFGKYIQTIDSMDDWNTMFSSLEVHSVEDDNYIMPDGLSLVVSEILPEVIRQDTNFVLGFRGHSGNGKTAAFSSIHSYLENSFGVSFNKVKVSCYGIARFIDFFIKRDFKNGETIDDYLPFYNALVDGNSVILLDEVNRVPSDLMNTLLGLMDGSETFYLNGREHKLENRIIFILAFNEGYGYTGTFDMDLALARRINCMVDFELPDNQFLFNIVLKKFPDMNIEYVNLFVDIVRKLDDANKSNKDDVSIESSVRLLLNMCNTFKLLKYDLRRLVDALKFSLINHASTQEEKAALFAICRSVLDAQGIRAFK